MNHQNDRLQMRAQQGTLPFFALIPMGANVVRKHISIPDDVLDEMRAAASRMNLNMSKFIAGGIQMALDDARRRFGPASNEVLPEAIAARRAAHRAAAAAAQPATALELVKPASADLVPFIERGGVLWFDMVALCLLLSVEPASVLDVLDPDDDLLDYQSKPWVDPTGLEAIVDLCKESTLRETVRGWIASV